MKIYVLSTTAVTDEFEMIVHRPMVFDSFIKAKEQLEKEIAELKADHPDLLVSFDENDVTVFPDALFSANVSSNGNDDWEASWRIDEIDI